MRKILITGLAGSGKSAICNELQRMGYEAVGIEDVKGLFKMYHKGTHKIFRSYDNSNVEHTQDAAWLFDYDKLKKLIGSQKQDIAFYCGISSDMNGLVTFFDKVIVLDADKEVLNERLKTREGTDAYGNTKEVRDRVLDWKDQWDENMKKKGVIFVNANDSIHDTAIRILKVLNVTDKVLQ